MWCSGTLRRLVSLIGRSREFVSAVLSIAYRRVISSARDAYPGLNVAPVDFSDEVLGLAHRLRPGEMKAIENARSICGLRIGFLRHQSGFDYRHW